MRSGALVLALVAVLAMACGSGAPPAPAPVPTPTPGIVVAPAPTPQGIATPPLPGESAEPSPTAPPAAAADPAPVPTPPYKNTVRWSTASEVDNFGYDVYRGTSKDGPFERLTKDPIPGAGTTDEPQKYSFVDENIDPYQTYFYYVEAISLAGVRERFTPIIQSKPKLQRPSGK
jgi:hypothetical protein